MSTAAQRRPCEVCNGSGACMVCDDAGTVGECCEHCHAPIDADQTLDYCFDPVECRSVVTCSATCASAYLATRPAPMRG